MREKRLEAGDSQPESSPPFPAHFARGRFYNPYGLQARGFLDLLKWKLTSRAERSPEFIFDVEQAVPPQQVESGELRATLVNHSTVLLQQGGLSILTDPIWSDRASPLSWMGPRRHRLPGVRRQDLPRIDVVLLSHNHYDHLDLPSLRWLASLGHSSFVVPIGVAQLLRSEKIGPLFELDWGDSAALGAATIYSVPAMHFSARRMFDRNRTLWCGYVIRFPIGTIYFAGDTAFGDHFAQIRSRFGRPSLSLLPIGAYQPRWFMSSVHMAPDQALRAHEILESRTSIAIHHGTFVLGDDGLDTPKSELAALPPPDSFLVLNNGESAAIPW